MIPTLNQSKCLRMLEEWKKVATGTVETVIQKDGSVEAFSRFGFDFEELTSLVLLCHMHGVMVYVATVNGGELLLTFEVPQSDPPSLTKLRRRAHPGRVLLGTYAKERKEGATA